MDPYFLAPCRIYLQPLVFLRFTAAHIQAHEDGDLKATAYHCDLLETRKQIFHLVFISHELTSVNCI